MYWHEEQERKTQAAQVNTRWPKYEKAVYEHPYLIARNLDTRTAEDNGWYVSWDAGDMNERIVIPAVTHIPTQVYWQARAVKQSVKLRYQSPSGPRNEAFILVLPIKQKDGIVIVEGPMDALAAAGAGYIGISLMGMYPSLLTMAHVHQHFAEIDMPIMVALDKGETANAIRIMTYFATQGRRVFQCELPKKDLAECLPKERKKFLDAQFKLFKQRSSRRRKKTAKRA